MKTRVSAVAFLYFSFINLAAAQFVIGATLPLSGPTMEQGQSLKDGLNSAVGEASRSDPSIGRSVKVIYLDDEGDPAKAERNVKTLVTAMGVEVVAGCIGEGHCAAVTREAAKYQVPVVGVIDSNSRICRAGSLAYCIHAAYSDEVAAVVQQIKALGLHKVNLWLSKDLESYAESVRSVLEREALSARTITPKANDYSAPAPTWISETPTVSGDAANVLLLNTQDAISVARWIRKIDRQSLIIGMSSSNAYEWLKKTQDVSPGTILTHSLPNPDIPTPTIVRHYQSALTTYSEFNLPYQHEQLEMYLAGRLLVQICGQKAFTRQAVTKLLNQGQFKIDDITVSFKDGQRMLNLPIKIGIVNRSGIVIE